MWARAQLSQLLLFEGFFFTSLYNFPASFKGSNFIHTELPHLPAHKEDSRLVLPASSMRRVKREFWLFFFTFLFCFVSEYTTESCALSSPTVHLHLPPLSSTRADLPINLYISFIFLLGVALLPEGWKKDGGNWTHFHHYNRLKLPLPGKFLSQKERGICTELAQFFVQCPLPTQTSRSWIYSPFLGVFPPRHK